MAGVVQVMLWKLLKTISTWSQMYRVQNPESG